MPLLSNPRSKPANRQEFARVLGLCKLRWQKNQEGLCSLGGSDLCRYRSRMALNWGVTSPAALGDNRAPISTRGRALEGGVLEVVLWEQSSWKQLLFSLFWLLCRTHSNLPSAELAPEREKTEIGQVGGKKSEGSYIWVANQSPYLLYL